jgi:lysyl endopeptidase
MLAFYNKHINFFSGCYAIILFLSNVHCYAQSSNASALPAGLNAKIYNEIPVFDIGSVDSIAKVQRKNFEQNIDTKVNLIGYNFKTNIRPDKAGLWKSYNAKYNTWLVKISSTNAKSMGLVLSNVKLEPGERLFIYNLHELVGMYDHQNIPTSGILPVDYVEGDEVVVEYDVPKQNRKQGTLVISLVSHGIQSQNKNGLPVNKRTEDDCYTCLDSYFWSRDKRSVVKIINYSDNGTFQCTGALVNNTAQDKKPYVLTAEHCVSINDDGTKCVFIFNLDDAFCEGSVKIQSGVLSGASNRASFYRNDFTLLEMSNYPPLGFNAYYAGWDISDAALDHVSCIHHPIGTAKRMALSNETVATSDFDTDIDFKPHASKAFWHVSRWDVGITEPGSSGSPIFNKNHRVMGTLTGGSSTCGFPYDDYFEKLSKSWTATPYDEKQLKHWLDPLSTNVTFVDGLDPFEGLSVSCDTLTNIKSDESRVYQTYKDGIGFYTGFNTDSIATYGEFFLHAGTSQLTGADFYVASINQDAQGGIVVNVNEDDNGFPGNQMVTFYVPYSRLNLGANYIEFYPYVVVNGNFFITYTMSYSDGDFFALQQAPFRAEGTNTAFMLIPEEGWKKMSDVNPDGLLSSIAIDAFLCHDVEAPTENKKKDFIIYPNPADNVLIGKFAQKQERYQAAVFDVRGQRQDVSCSVYEDTLVFSVGDLLGGVYVVRVITSSGKFYTQKFVKR